MNVSRQITDSERRKVGVWQTDAPDGYYALVVYNSAGRRLLRVEISQDAYSHAWVTWLERWLHRWDTGFLKIVR